MRQGLPFVFAVLLAVVSGISTDVQADRFESFLTNDDLKVLRGENAKTKAPKTSASKARQVCSEGTRTCNRGYAWACVKGLDGLQTATWWEPVGKCRKSLPKEDSPAKLSQASAPAQPPAVRTQVVNYSDLYRNISPAVVLIYGTDDAGTGSVGTGSIVTEDGLVLTNAHVVSKGDRLWNRVWVYLKPERVTGNQQKDLKHGYPAEVVAVHPDYDLALVQMAGSKSGLPTISLSRLDGIEVGEPTIAIGHPSGGGRWSLTTGRISASWEDYRGVKGWHVFQTETALNPGNSGGPLLDGTGAIVGINTFIVRKDAGGEVLAGLNFAVKATVARQWLESVIHQLPRGETLRAQLDVARPEPQVVAAQEPRHEARKVSAPMVRKADKPASEKRVVKSPPPRPDARFVSGIKPGNTYGDEQLDTLLKRVDAAFDDMDQELRRLRNK